MENLQEKFIQIKLSLNTFWEDLAEETGIFDGVTLVGSHVGEKEMESMNDLDFVLVLKSLDKDLYDLVTKRLEEFCQKWSDDNFGLVIETRFGPVKKISDKPITVQIHALLYSTESFISYTKESPLVAYDWYRFPVLLGRSLAEICPILPITYEDVIKSRGGAQYSIEQVEDSVNIGVSYVFNLDGTISKSLDKWPQNDKQKAETYFKAVKNVLINIFKVKNQKNEMPTMEQIYSLFEELFGVEYVVDLKSLESTYKVARSEKGELSPDEISLAKEKSKFILEKLLSFLSVQ
jgi:hypothetical protein